MRRLSWFCLLALVSCLLMTACGTVGAVRSNVKKGISAFRQDFSADKAVSRLIDIALDYKIAKSQGLSDSEAKRLFLQKRLDVVTADVFKRYSGREMDRAKYERYKKLAYLIGRLAIKAASGVHYLSPGGRNPDVMPERAISTMILIQNEITFSRRFVANPNFGFV